MGEQKYDVLVDNTIIATGLQLNYATILIEGIFQKYYEDYTLNVTIKRSDLVRGAEE